MKTRIREKDEGPDYFLYSVLSFECRQSLRPSIMFHIFMPIIKIMRAYMLLI